MNEQLKVDLKNIGFDKQEASDLTLRDVIFAFRKKALKSHPEKARKEYTAEFQDLSQPIKMFSNMSMKT